MERLSTGNVWIDTFIAAVVPFAMHLFLPPGTYKPISGSLALDAVLLATMPVLRRSRHGFQSLVRASGIGLWYNMKNTYETTVRFQKEVGEGRRRIDCWGGGGG